MSRHVKEPQKTYACFPSLRRPSSATRRTAPQFHQHAAGTCGLASCVTDALFIQWHRWRSTNSLNVSTPYKHRPSPIPYAALPAISRLHFSAGISWQLIVRLIELMVGHVSLLSRVLYGVYTAYVTRMILRYPRELQQLLQMYFSRPWRRVLDV